MARRKIIIRMLGRIKRRREDMEKTKQQIREINMEVVTLLTTFLHKTNIRKAETKDGMIKIYNIGDDLIRVDIKTK